MVKIKVCRLLQGVLASVYSKSRLAIQRAAQYVHTLRWIIDAPGSSSELTVFMHYVRILIELSCLCVMFCCIILENAVVRTYVCGYALACSYLLCTLVILTSRTFQPRVFVLWAVDKDHLGRSILLVSIVLTVVLLLINSLSVWTSTLCWPRLTQVTFMLQWQDFVSSCNTQCSRLGWCCIYTLDYWSMFGDIIRKLANMWN